MQLQRTSRVAAAPGDWCLLIADVEMQLVLLGHAVEVLSEKHSGRMTDGRVGPVLFVVFGTRSGAVCWCCGRVIGPISRCAVAQPRRGCVGEYMVHNGCGLGGLG